MLTNNIMQTTFLFLQLFRLQTALSSYHVQLGRPYLAQDYKFIAHIQKRTNQYQPRHSKSTCKDCTHRFGRAAISQYPLISFKLAGVDQIDGLPCSTNIQPPHAGELFSFQYLFGWFDKAQFEALSTSWGFLVSTQTLKITSQLAQI